MIFTPPRRNGDEPISTCIIIQMTFPHPVMNQCKYTLSVKGNASWKVAFLFGKGVGTGELYFLDGALQLGMGWYHISTDMPILPTLERAASQYICTIFYRRYRYCRCWKMCQYADISDTDTGIGPSLFIAFLNSHLTLIVAHRESQGIHAAFLLRPSVTLMYRSNPKDQLWLVFNSDLNNFDQRFV